MRCWDAAARPGAGCPRARPRSPGGTGEAEAEAESGRSSTKHLAPRHGGAAAGELRTTERPRALPGPVPQGGSVLGQGSKTGEKRAIWDQPQWLCPAAAHGFRGAPCPGGVSASEAGPGVPMLQGPPPQSEHLGEGQKAGSIRGAAGGVRGSARAAVLGKLSPGELRPWRAGGVLLACSCPEMFVPAAQKSCLSILVLCGLLPPVPGVADGAVSPSAALARRCRCTKLLVPRCWARRRCPRFKQSLPISWPKEGLSQVQLWLSSQCQHHRFSCRSLSLVISTGWVQPRSYSIFPVLAAPWAVSGWLQAG